MQGKLFKWNTPQGMSSATLNRLRGFTAVYTQIVQAGNSLGQWEGVWEDSSHREFPTPRFCTLVTNADNSITLTKSAPESGVGASSNTMIINTLDAPDPLGLVAPRHTYYIKLRANAPQGYVIYMSFGGNIGSNTSVGFLQDGQWSVQSKLLTPPAGTGFPNQRRIFMLVKNGEDGQPIPTGTEVSIASLMIFDLTAMFGDGYEPTLEETDEMFPLTYYPYSSGELCSVSPVGIMSFDSLNTNVDTLYFPNDFPSSSYGFEHYLNSVGIEYDEIQGVNLVKRIGWRAHESGDESDWQTMITDGVHTVYVLPQEQTTTISDNVPYGVANGGYERGYFNLMLSLQGISAGEFAAFGEIEYEVAKDEMLPNKVAFYMQRSDEVGETYDLERDFVGLRYLKAEGMNTLGESKSIYTEEYAEAEELRVFLPDTYTHKATKITMTFLILGDAKQRQTTLDDFLDYLREGRHLFWDTVRNRQFEFIVTEEIKVSDEKWHGTQPYIEIQVPMQNIAGRTVRV